LEALKQRKKVARAGWNGNQRPPVVSDKPLYVPKNRLEVVGDYVFLLGSKGSVAVFDVDLLPRLEGHENFTEGPGGYFVVSLYSGEKRVNKKLHTFLFDCPDGYCIDHINGDFLDNRRENIRIASYKENVRNSSARGCTSAYKGVSLDASRDKWISSIQVDGKTKHLGRYDREEDAAKAYDDAQYSYYGEYARLNFPNRKLRPRMHLWLKPACMIKSEWCKDGHLKEIVDAHDGEILALGTICMYTHDGSGGRAVLTGWLASQSDMLLEDWQIVE
jgi:hypothetical protein